MNITQARNFSHLPHGKPVHLPGDTVTMEGQQIPKGHYVVSHEGETVNLTSANGKKFLAGQKDTAKTHWDHAADPLSDGFWDTPAYREGA